MSLDPYPTDEELTTIREWDFRKGYVGLMEYVESLWQYADWGWRRKGLRYYVSTAGWSGNEDLIQAMSTNYVFWSQCWESNRRGGHYRLRIPARLKGPS